MASSDMDQWCDFCNCIRTAVAVDGGSSSACSKCGYELTVSRLQDEAWVPAFIQSPQPQPRAGGGGEGTRQDVGMLLTEVADALGVMSDRVVECAKALFAGCRKKDKPHAAAALYIALEENRMGRPQVQVAHFFNLADEVKAVADAVRDIRKLSSSVVVCRATPHEVFQAIKDRIGHDHPSVRDGSFATLSAIGRTVSELLSNDEMALRPPHQLAAEAVRRMGNLLRPRPHRNP